MMDGMRFPPSLIARSPLTAVRVSGCIGSGTTPPATPGMGMRQPITVANPAGGAAVNANPWPHATGTGQGEGNIDAVDSSASLGLQTGRLEEAGHGCSRTHADRTPEGRALAGEARGGTGRATQRGRPLGVRRREESHDGPPPGRGR